MTGGHRMADEEALRAELKCALQHQRAAYERLTEIQREVEELLARVRICLARAQQRVATNAHGDGDRGGNPPE